MNRMGIVLTVVLVAVLGIANIILGMNLITPLALAKERGAGVPWYIVWTLILVSMGCAVALGGLLVSAMARKR